jgi:hypothetical protein
MEERGQIIILDFAIVVSSIIKLADSNADFGVRNAEFMLNGVIHKKDCILNKETAQWFSAWRKGQSVICKESEKVQSDRFSILIPLPFLRLSLADATRAKNLGSCSNL